MDDVCALKASSRYQTSERNAPDDRRKAPRLA
jgi:hypothetical protein